MAIARKPKAENKDKKQVDIDALINKGGSPVANDKMKTKDKSILLRIPSDTLKTIDEVVSSKQIKTPRHTWLLEAVFEKLEREARY